MEGRRRLGLAARLRRGPRGPPACPLQEAYEGAEAGCEVTGLPPGSQHIFCVKALYDDASFLWSQPLMVTTATTKSAGAAVRAAKKGSST